MDLFNKIMTTLFRVLLFPFHKLSTLWALLLLSLLTGLLMLYMFKKVSNQQGIRVTKNRLKAHLLAIRLYKHDNLLSLITIGQILMENGRYLLFALKPMLVMIVPVTLIIIQLGAHYSYDPAQVNQVITVSVRTNSDVDLNNVSIVPSNGIRVDAPPLYIPATHEIYWRIYTIAPGSATLTFQYNHQSEKKNILVGKSGPLSVKRVRSSLVALLHPAEPRLAWDSFLKEITIGYSENRVQVGGFSMHWLVFFLLVSVAAGFLAKGFFRIQL